MNWILQHSPIFFDFDGLLVNTEKFHYQAYQKLLENYSESFPCDFVAFCKIAHTNSAGLQMLIQNHAPKLFKRFGWKKLYQEKQKEYIKLIKTGEIDLMPGVEEILKLIQKSRIPHCIVTNSTLQQVNLIIEKIPILKTIPHWITRENYDNPKPAPDGYLKAIEIVGNSKKMLGFEDTLKGISSLEKASIKSVLICAPNHPQINDIKKDQLYFSSLTDII